MASAALPPETGQPSRVALAWLYTRIGLLRLRRGFQNLTAPVSRLQPGSEKDFPVQIAIHRSSLTSANSVERRLELGKIQNLRVAARALDGLVIPSGGTFSFWRQVGKCLKRKGYTQGRQLQEGCLVPVVGGGICQLSNALYDLALQTGCEIVERHGHTRIVPGSAAARDRDATVAWNHVDLRFKPDVEVLLKVRLTANALEVSFWSATPVETKAKSAPRTLRQAIDHTHSCGICDRIECVLYPTADMSTLERTAFLVDEVWPEFDTYLQETRSNEDVLMLPLKGRSNYAWNPDGYAEIAQARLATLRRTVRGRRLANQGAARQVARLQAAKELAQSYAKQLKPEVTHMVVALEFLPHLWKAGVLGGRTFDILMTRLPMAELQERLDSAHQQNPERSLLSDFRAPDDLIRAENEALAAARLLITPHQGIAVGDPRRRLLGWQMPKPIPWKRGKVMAFPGPTVSRKGAFEVREAAKRLGVPVVAMGSQLEGPGFWDNVDMATPSENWLEGVLAVVQPAVLEDKPRRLLRAIASGCPVIVTEACGLPPGPLVHIVPRGDVDAIVEAWRRIVAAG